MSSAIAQWLGQLGLGRYAPEFEENAIRLEHLSDLDHDTLKDIGVAAVGHRLTILKAAAKGEPQGGDAPSQSEVPLVAEAERRQLTVMFCDLVGSTQLSQRLDPEDLREINRAFQNTCKNAIERYEGFVARYMGDGVLAYFGYPQAHEDDAERAVHAGLGLISAIEDLEKTLGEVGGSAWIYGLASPPVRWWWVT